jgi:hypothetical protein
MSARIALIALCGLVAIGGVSAAIADNGDGDETAGVGPVDVRKDDTAADTDLVDDEDDDEPTGDRDKTRGDDGTNGGDNSDGDRTAGDDGTSWGHNNDRDATGGDDGTAGGDNSEVAVAPAPAPAAAATPVYDDYSDDGVAYSGS